MIKTWFNHSLKYPYLIFIQQRQPRMGNFLLPSRQQLKNIIIISTKGKTQFHFSKYSLPLYFQFYTCQAKAIIKNRHIQVYSSTSQFRSIPADIVSVVSPTVPVFVEYCLTKTIHYFLCFIIGTRCTLLSFLKSCLRCKIEGQISI